MHSRHEKKLTAAHPHFPDLPIFCGMWTRLCLFTSANFRSDSRPYATAKFCPCFLRLFGTQHNPNCYLRDMMDKSVNDSFVSATRNNHYNGRFWFQKKFKFSQQERANALTLFSKEGYHWDVGEKDL